MRGKRGYAQVHDTEGRIHWLRGDQTPARMRTHPHKPIVDVWFDDGLHVCLSISMDGLLDALENAAEEIGDFFGGRGGRTPTPVPLEPRTRGGRLLSEAVAELPASADAPSRRPPPPPTDFEEP